MTGTRDSLVANIGGIIKTGAIKRRILQTILPMLFSLPQRHNMKQVAKWSGFNEGTIHNWYSRELGLAQFNRELVACHGSGDFVTIFDPSFMPKSGKKTPGIERRWSGQAQATKRGIEIGCFAVGDIGHHTAFHLHAELTPSGADLKDAGKNLMSHYVDLVGKRADDILHFGGILACDGYFGVSTFVNPVMELGIVVISCLKINMALHYAPMEVTGKKRRGRPAVKGAKIKWDAIDENLLPVVYEDKEKRVRCAEVWVKCLGRIVRLVAVEYLKADGSLQSRKLYFCTQRDKAWDWILERYGIRFQIEFLFRDAKQFLGITHCQSTNPTKIENHANLALTALSVAKVTHWLPIAKEERGPFSMAELKMYYHNLALIERFSCALGLDPTLTKNNPKIKELLFSTCYAQWAA
jgi:hypothetical protein